MYKRVFIADDRIHESVLFETKAMKCFWLILGLLDNSFILSNYKMFKIRVFRGDFQTIKMTCT